MADASSSSFKPLKGSSLLGRHAALIVVAHTCLGAGLFSFIEGWSPITSFYFCIICVTTVVSALPCIWIQKRADGHASRGSSPPAHPNIPSAWQGYGDVVPKTTLGKAYATLYILMGVTLIASCIGILVGRMHARRRQKGQKDRETTLQTLTRAAAEALAVVVAGTTFGCLVEGWSLPDSIYWTIVSISSQVPRIAL